MSELGSHGVHSPGASVIAWCDFLPCAGLCPKVRVWRIATCGGASNRSGGVDLGDEYHLLEFRRFIPVGCIHLLGFLSTFTSSIGICVRMVVHRRHS